MRELLSATGEGRDVNLNAIKKRLCAKHQLDTSPRLVDVIAAVPAEHKKTLLPRLRAKPVRTASGVSAQQTAITTYLFPPIVHNKYALFF